MNILHLITSMDKGGAENHLAVLSKAQKKSGNNIHIIYLKGNDYWKNHLNLNGIKTINLEKQKNNIFKKILFLRNYLKEFKIEVLHAHLPHMEILAFFAILFNNKLIKFFITKHVDNNFSGGSVKKNKSLFAELITFIIFLRAQKIIAISKAVKKFFENNFFFNFSKKIKVIYYGIDKNYINLCSNSALKQNIKNKNEILFCYVGRLVKQKQVELIIKSYFIFRKKLSNKKTKLLIVGNGPEKNKLKKLVKDLNLNNEVKFQKHTNYVSEVFKKVDIFCMNTKFEGLGLVMLEAMFFSIPIIAPRISAVPEVVKNKFNGILVRPNDIKQYSEAMQSMVKSNIRKKYSKNSMKFLNKKFNVKQMVNQTFKLYKAQYK